MKNSIALIFLLNVFIQLNAQTDYLFSKVDPNKSKVIFSNQISETDSFNYFFYDNIYNGAGVAVGDINNDQFPDLFFVSNTGECKLFLNKGKLKFKDITTKALPGFDKSGWHTSASMVDINADGYLDIYICRHGLGQSSKVNFANLLYINNKNLTFSEQSKKYGLNDPGRSIDADFFDYDQDGDLDAFITNHRENLSINEIYHKTGYIEQLHSNRLYRNDNGTFVDVTKESGVLSFGYCLATSIGDVNNDGWPDIFVSSDYGLPDFLFINQRDGKFKNEAKQRLRHTSHYSMGIDMADFNNDLFTDIMVPDMSNKDYVKSKTNMGSMSVASFWDNVAKGYNHQYMYNALHLNLGSGYFSEIAHLSGIASTDWSWTPLFEDFDQDGYKDLFITNGYLRDVRDQDFTNQLKSYLATKPKHVNYDSLLNLIPVTKENNFFFQNKRDLTFQDVSSFWCVAMPEVSQGAAVADLDLDGDLDIVINNMNSNATILENKLAQKNYLKINLKGGQDNPFAYGTKVIVHSSLGDQMQELNPSRGYASCSDNQLIFGFQKNDTVKSIEIVWNWKEQTNISSPTLNKTLVVDYKSSTKELANQSYFVVSKSKPFLKIKELEYDDYANEILMPHKMSELGPFMSTASFSVNGNSRRAINKNVLYIGGTRMSAGHLFIEDDKGELIEVPQIAFKADSAYEDAGSVFVDVDNDSDLDLFVVSGGNEFVENSTMYHDRLYINDGNWNFKRSENVIPSKTISGQKVIAFDFENDKDQDLIIFGRQVPGKYGANPESYILLNEGGHFKDVTDMFGKEFNQLGMVTDATPQDFDQDGDLDLIVVGEWMKPTFFENNQGNFILTDKLNSSDNFFGWWNTIHAVDINNDGINELLLGNTGLNNKFHPSVETPLSLYLEDVDNNQQIDIILTKYFSGVCHPVRGRSCLSDQIPDIRKKYETYHDFATTPITELFQFKTSPKLATDFRNGYLQLKNGQYEFVPFESFGQIGTINKFVPINLNNDGFIDFIAIGNRYEAEIETPRYDSNPGLVFLNENGTGKFKIICLEPNGPFINRNAKDAVLIGKKLLVSNAGESIDVLEFD